MEALHANRISAMNAELQELQLRQQKQAEEAKKLAEINADRIRSKNAKINELH